MSVITYLERRANQAVLSAAEEASITTSVNAIQNRLRLHFSNISTHFRFGSSTRGTILPRSMDENSDIDYMIVFSDRGYQPQTYLDRLKRFAESRYFHSEIKQSSPTIVLELNHIKFDLVPAVSVLFSSYGYQIPAGPATWQDTNPNDFNSTLTAKNIQEGYRLKPAIRLLKFWNAKNGYPFESYWLEKFAVSQAYYSCYNIRDYLFEMISRLQLGLLAPQWKQDRVARARKIIMNVLSYERMGSVILAELEVMNLIPA